MNDEEKDIWFSCGCREWRIIPTDKKGVSNQPENTAIDHKCEKVIVYRDLSGMKRYFKRT